LADSWTRELGAVTLKCSDEDGGDEPIRIDLRPRGSMHVCTGVSSQGKNKKQTPKLNASPEDFELINPKQNHLLTSKSIQRILSNHQQ
jgi:hypothetical protein